ncbi:MAG: hypothetical protein KatS3mg129_0261 [Leptospiraceae bacterium]|nr:MAG: hypothetical protein KatS3mg129_0261 [Leptospiraceae bacterium]
MGFMKPNFLLILILNITLVLCQFPKQNIPQRKIIYLTKEEKEFVLMEMRQLLKSIHNIHTGLYEENYNFAYNSAKKVGMNMVNELQAAEKFILLKLPSEFKQLGFSTHKQFDILAESIKHKNNKEIQKNLSILTSYCISCHDLYALEVEEK